MCALSKMHQEYNRDHAPKTSTSGYGETAQFEFLNVQKFIDQVSKLRSSYLEDSKGLGTLFSHRGRYLVHNCTLPSLTCLWRYTLCR